MPRGHFLHLVNDAFRGLRVHGLQSLEHAKVTLQRPSLRHFDAVRHAGFVRHVTGLQPERFRLLFAGFDCRLLRANFLELFGRLRDKLAGLGHAFGVEKLQQRIGGHFVGTLHPLFQHVGGLVQRRHSRVRPAVVRTGQNGFERRAKAVV